MFDAIITIIEGAIGSIVAWVIVENRKRLMLSAGRTAERCSQSVSSIRYAIDAFLRWFENVLKIVAEWLKKGDRYCCPVIRSNFPLPA